MLALLLPIVPGLLLAPATPLIPGVTWGPACGSCAVHMSGAHAEGKEEEQQLDAEAAIAAAAIARDPERIAGLRASQLEAVAALQAEVAEAGDSHPVAAALAKKGSLTASTKFLRSLKKPKGTMALIGEGAMRTQATLGGYDLNDPLYLSSQFRESGCAGVCVGVGTERELSPDALAKTVAEQASQKGEFPGPVPVMARGPFVDEAQLAKVASQGAEAVLLDTILNGPEATATLAAAATELGLQPVIRVGTEEELGAAVDAGAAVVCVGDCSLPQAAELREKIPQGVIAVCDVPVRDVRGAWMVRDMGYNALIVSDSLTDVCVRDRVPPVAVLKGMLSKGSVQYGLGMQKGRLEGAKENLGTLAM